MNMCSRWGMAALCCGALACGRAEKKTEAAALASASPGAAPASPLSSSATTTAAPSPELLQEGAKAPEFEGTAQTGERISSAALRGKPVVVYFYPKDDTPGCTKEACELRDAWTDLEKTGAKVIGVSTDDEASHTAFAAKYHLPFALLSDKDEKLTKAFGVPVHLGFAKRVTFIIDRGGTVAKVFPNVTPTGHASQILEELRKLGS